MYALRKRTRSPNQCDPCGRSCAGRKCEDILRRYWPGAKTARLKISIIIPAYNEERLLAAVLCHVSAACAAFCSRGWAVETIVCDNNSTDRTGAIARASGATVVFERINQISRARNTGATAASGDWLVFLDADSYPSAGLFSDVAEAMGSGDCLAGGCTVILDQNSRLGKVAIGLWNQLSRWRKLMAGSFIFCEAAAFHQAGGFSEELFVGEELDLSRKLKQMARQSGQRIIIIDAHPLLTSGRKLELYTVREYLWFLLKTIFSFGAAMRRRDACAPWYDGRR